MNETLIKKGVATLLSGLLGPEWKSDPNYEDTPRRVAKFYAEMFAEHDYNITTFPGDNKQMIVLSHYQAWTLCPHHLLPVELDVSLAYIPNGEVVGVSKLARLVMNHFTEPVLQEDLTDSIADELMTKLKTSGPKPKTPLGAAVLIYGRHDCMRIRGIKSANSCIITSAMRGIFLEKPDVKEEFLSLVKED
jgi:GTP cyclohydrolase I